MKRGSIVRAPWVLLGALLVVACQTDAPFSPSADVPGGDGHGLHAEAYVTRARANRISPYPCDLRRPIKWSGVITPAGGKLVAPTAPKNEIYVPRGAVSRAARIEVVIPASGILEIDIKANRRDHFEFQKPIRVTLDYGMCGHPRRLIPGSAWHWDGSNTFFEQMPGFVVDTRAQTISFTTDHLTGFVIAD